METVTWSRQALPVNHSRGAAPVVVFSRCGECDALVNPGREFAHDEWHERLRQS